MKNKKPIIALGALAVVGLVAGTIAYFTSQVTFDNEFTTATYQTSSQEVFQSPSNWTPGQKVDKTLTTTNEGTIPVAVRVSLSEYWFNENYDPTKSPAEQPAAAVISNPPANAAIINTTAPSSGTWDWIAHTDGKYYYGKAVYPNQTTTSFIEGVTLNPNLSTTSTCDNGTSTVVDGHTVTTKTCETTIDGLGKATYILTLTVDTVQYDKYATVWSGAPTIADVPPQSQQP